MRFKKIENKLPEQKKNFKWSWLLLKLSFFFFLLSFAIYGGAMFYNTHDFRSPILFQNPVPKKQINMHSPTASQSAFIGQSYAEEPKNPYDEKSPKGIAWKINLERFGIENWESWNLLIEKESGWNPYAINQSSGACGIPQSLPCSKMDCERWDYECQLEWMANYIEDRYETPMKALAFHFEKNWY